MAKFLTYPLGTKYRTSGWGDQIKDGKSNGSIPCNDEIHVGNYNQTVDGYEWKGELFGQDNAADSAKDNRHWEQAWGGTSQKGLCYWAQTSSNNWYHYRWFDIGSEGGRFNTYCNNNARSSWLSDVTGVYFLFNGHDCTTTRGCYSGVEQVGIRYRNPDGQIKIKRCSVKLGDIDDTEWVRGADKKMFGMRLSNSDCNTILGNKNWKFLGLRIGMWLHRDSGPQTDWIQGGVTGIRLYLGNFDNAWNTTNKRALVGAGNRTWSDFNNSNSKFQFEMR